MSEHLFLQNLENHSDAIAEKEAISAYDLELYAELEPGSVVLYKSPENAQLEKWIVDSKEDHTCCKLKLKRETPEGIEYKDNVTMNCIADVKEYTKAA